MAFDWFWKAMGSSPKKNQKKSRAVVAQADSSRYSGLSDAELRDAASDVVTEQSTSEDGHHFGGQVDDAPALLAILREAASRTLNMEPFDVQMQGTYRLLHGDVVEMATGEGKTLAGAMAAVGFALQGKRVHVITVNSYLAGRDNDWMGPMFDFFGLTHGAIHEDLTADQRRDIYSRDVIFGAINELGFDVLRDQLITRRADQVRTPADVAVIDEADSVMVDEALVPLVLAGSEPGPAPAGRITDLVKRMEEDKHFHVSEDHRNVFLTDEGAAFVEKELGVESLYEDEGELLVQVNVALHAEHLLIRDVHYIVRDGKVALIDGSRGRVAELQRWPDGLQAAVEAKEGLDVTDGGRILDQITIQALVGMYPEVCGMTGTALAAGDQLRQFYNLQVSVIEPNVPNIRFDEADRVYVSAAERNDAVVKHIVEVQKTGQPQLVGTQDVAESEELAEALLSAGVECSVLNAKNHEAEAAVVAEAGRPGRVTVSTQMAGRGTDIKLGGTDEAEHDEVVETGGLHVVGVGRFRSQRLDNQLRGRAGRQGDPGSSLFFVSLEDDVVAIGGAGEELQAQPEEDGLLPQKKVQQFVDHCQRVTEGQMLDIHATTWKYNKLIKDQRDIVNDRRDTLLDTAAAWDDLSYHNVDRAAELKKQGISEEVLEQAAREIMLFHLDNEWSEHLAYLDDVRESIHLRAIARESPIDEFHRMSIAAFGELAERAVNKARETFDEVEITSDGAQLGEMGLHKPSATWTYMVNDNPLSSSGGSVMGSIVQMFR
ncbi:accessory Sec system translocase SecA2 [Corynebacterium jeikeium]|uniref:accessory Sec system translocase SecA2 n=1 Tax=Corynebacterium jeikeium TaxID=38289 RepID=UPI0001B71937|nr:accessory Sec system translocase SecA2 [Corynebacterium jeikeium]EEW16445.1 SecA cross-linking domain protein [Corynebacterium jeikeium ATCC 43734]OOD34133.1 accessory Sec system translocase SecA2 [Corynebacterium jeikeium]WCZ53463.1 preprotein translocase subunit SecA [Corynebacterium jeikeium]SUY81226.1 preprotein translocase subunit SecA [Corynebacterium jeikeium]